MPTLDQSTELIRQLDALYHRIDALDAAATGICAGIRLNTLGSEAAYQLIDVIAADIRARTSETLRLLRATSAPVVRPFAAGAAPAASGEAGPGGRPRPASSAAAP